MGQRRTDRTHRTNPREPAADAPAFAGTPTSAGLTDPESRPAGRSDDIGPGLLEAAIAGAGTKEPVPEGDRLEQSIPLDPIAHDPVRTLLDRDHPAESVDVADWLEQQIPVLGSDDDYPHDAETHGS